MPRTILHVDMNNFYASVECMLNPELRDKPIAVCGDAEQRHGIVLAKNYIAKACGVKTGDVIWQAKEKCRNLVIVPPHYEEYMKFSKAAKEIYGRYTEFVEPFGMDECWLDVTSGINIFGDGEKIANEIRETIKLELGVTVSIGVSFNKIFAKLGSDMKKPDAVTIIPSESFEEIIYSLPASDMLGVGRATYSKLLSYGIVTIGDIARWPMDFFKRRFGKCGVDIWRHAMGMDLSPVIPLDVDIPEKSVGHGTTTNKDLTSSDEVYRVILELSQEIGHRLHKYKKRATGIAIYIRDNDLITRQWQCMLDISTQSAFEIAKVAYALFENNYNWSKPIRTVTVRAIGLQSENVPDKIDLFCDTNEMEKNEIIDNTIENIRMRFGRESIKNAVLLKDSKLSDTVNTQIKMPTGIRTCSG